MKPFNFKAAQRGEPILYRTYEGYEKAFYVGIDGESNPVIHQGGCSFGVLAADLFMAARKRVVWVNVYPGEYGVALCHDSESLANKAATKISDRIGGRAWPLEIEE